MAPNDALGTAPFDIPGQLLAGPEGDWRWNNLGYWSTDACYSTACRQLAMLHGDALSLQPHHRLLELACGYGAGLELWQQTYGVTDYHALELRQNCVDHLIYRQNVPVERVTLGSFTRCKSIAPWHERFDALVCVDAAYHAPSLAGFTDTLTYTLKPGGKAVFSTLLSTEFAEPTWHRRLRRAAGIADASVMSEAALAQTLAASGLQLASIQYLEHAVFGGFSDWVSQRHSELRWRQRTSLAWLKVLATAHWCRYLARRPVLRYGLVQIIKAPLPEPVGQA